MRNDISNGVKTTKNGHNLFLSSYRLKKCRYLGLYLFLLLLVPLL